MLELAAENPTAARVLVVRAVVDVVDQYIVLDCISWSSPLQHWVVGFHTKFAQRILAVVTNPSEVIRATTEPVF